MIAGQIAIDGCSWRVDDAKVPDGRELKVLTFVERDSGVTVVVPLELTAAAEIGAALRGKPSIEIARVLPPEVRG